MLPKTKIIFSLLYNEKFHKNLSKNDIKKLKSNCKEFVRLYNKNINKILKTIKKYSGFLWEDIRIPICVVEKVASFTLAPMISLCYKKNNKIMIQVLIHELVHVNLSFFYPNIRKKAFHEGAAVLVTQYTRKELFPDFPVPLFEKRYDKYLKKMRYDLNKHPLRYYLKKRKIMVK